MNEIIKNGIATFFAISVISISKLSLLSLLSLKTPNTHAELARKHREGKQKRKEGPYRSDVKSLNYVCIREILAIRRSTPLDSFQALFEEIR